ncbi:helix-turn-helix transcriptional regulator [Paenibacillus sp. TRM 82003]|nr:helix-turn-helix transcriptional regulator [Paenibacillus sp. TRM 82003]
MHFAKLEAGDVDSVLKQTRERAGMTLEAAANRLRISPGYLHQIENGDRGVGGARAEQLADLYEKGKDELFIPTRYIARYCKGGSL